LQVRLLTNNLVCELIHELAGKSIFKPGPDFPDPLFSSIMMKYIYAFIATAIVLLAVDFLWLKFVMSSVFKSELGEIVLASPRMSAAIMFYILYAIGLVVLIISRSGSTSWSEALLLGGLFGLVAYGTYDLTNLATLKVWTVKLAAIDMAWGSILTAASVAAGRAAYLLAD